MSSKHRHRTNHHHGPPPVQETPPANLPIPPQPIPYDDAVRGRAYELWEAAGRPEDDGVRFWYEAERELKGR
jgi:hypothetical protein